MINSLFKDSHITRKSRFLKSPLSQSGVPENRNKSEYKCATPAKMMNSYDIIVKKPAEISFSGLSSANKTPFYMKDWFTRGLESANGNPVLFSAGIGLALTCVLRPLSIVISPGSKKNNDDKKYAAAHSMASGIIGFVLAFIVSAPISAAVKKLKANPEDYIKKNTDLFPSANALQKLPKEVQDKIPDLLKRGDTCINQLPDILFAAPKAIITIALLPLILKNVFGLTKKRQDDLRAVQYYPILNFKSSSLESRKSMQKFMGGMK